jgi:oligo-1,6-glucosidase
MTSNNTIISTTLDTKWWKEAVIYQIYPRSFMDSNGDGIGDLQGIISKLDYLKSLGIDAIWLNPIFESPNDDNGYDVSDYRSILADFGTMEDFDILLKGLKERGIKLILDLVFNHSSDEHFWFQESRKSRDNPYRDYYYWWPAEKGTPPYRWSWFDIESNAWKYDATTDAYYLHYFSVKQPDLNWNNPKLREDLYAIMRFWLDKGIDGFRMDAFQFISKDLSFPELPNDILGNIPEIMKYYGRGPHLHDYIQEMHREVLQHYDVMTVSEGAGGSPEEALLFVDPDRKELSMAYHLEGVEIGSHVMNYGIINYKKLYTHWDDAFKTKGWLSIFLANHDQPRMVSKFGNDSSEFRAICSKMLTTFILTMRGTPYYFQGDELGMANIRFDSISDYNDIDTINKYEFIKSQNGDLEGFIEEQKQASRENSRTPFQWNTTPNAGFTEGKPWLKVHPNYTKINVESQEKNTDSTLNYFRTLVQLRKKEPTLIYGSYTLLDEENENIYAYLRELNGRKIVILLNFTSNEATFSVPFSFSSSKVLLSNYNQKSMESNKLQAYEAIIIELSSS